MDEKRLSAIEAGIGRWRITTHAEPSAKAYLASYLIDQDLPALVAEVRRLWAQAQLAEAA